MIDSDLRYDPYPLTSEGAIVEVIDGPLNGIRGRLVRKGSNHQLTLAVEFISRAVSVSVDTADVRPL